MRSVRFGMHDLAFPPPGAPQLRDDLIKWLREDRLKQIVSGNLSDHFLCRPPVELRGATIPVGDNVMHIADEYRVVGEIEKPRLLAHPFLSPHSAFNIGVGAIPFYDFSEFVAQRHGTAQNPPIFSARQPDAFYVFVWRSVFDRRAPSIRDSLALFGMNHRRPFRASQILQRQTQLLPTSIDEI